MDIRLKLLSSLQKVFLDAEPLENPAEGRLTGLLNETISFQAAWRNLDAEVRTMIRLEVRSPIARFVRVRQVKHVPVRFAAFPDADENYLRKTPGLYPDLLSEAPPVWRVWCDKWESAWIDVEPDATAEPGSWPVEIVLTDLEGNILASRTQTVELLNARLPEQALIHTKWFHCDCLCSYYDMEMFSDEFFRVAENFVRQAVKRGINMILTPIHTPPLDTAVGGERPTCQLVDVYVEDGGYRFGFANLDRWVAMCERCGVRYYEMAHLFTQWGAKHAPKIVARTADGERRLFGWETDATGPEYRRFLEAYLPALTAHLKELGIAERCWFHISDEPHLDMLEDYRAARDMVAGLLQGFPVLDALSSFEFYQTGAVAKPVPATNHIQPFLEAGVKGLWTYYCIGQYKDVSNMFMAMPSARNRILGVQLYKFDIEGFLHWGYNFYYCQQSLYPLDPYSITDGDGFGPAGDCFQVYPGRGGVPEESIRMMVTDEALNDLNALRLLEQLRGRDYVLSLIDEGLAEPITFDRYPTDDAWLLRLRERVNREIVRAASRSGQTRQLRA